MAERMAQSAKGVGAWRMGQGAQRKEQSARSTAQGAERKEHSARSTAQGAERIGHGAWGMGQHRAWGIAHGARLRG